MTTKPRLLIVDGMALLFRSFSLRLPWGILYAWQMEHQRMEPKDLCDMF